MFHFIWSEDIKDTWILKAAAACFSLSICTAMMPDESLDSATNASATNCRQTSSDATWHMHTTSRRGGGQAGGEGGGVEPLWPISGVFNACTHCTHAGNIKLCHCAVYFDKKEDSMQQEASMHTGCGYQADNAGVLGL